MITNQAAELRRAGKSRREIKEILGPMGNSVLTEALRGVPPPEWTRRPNAKDDLRAKARELRAKGMDYEQICAALHVSKSSVSLWVRDMPRPPRISTEEGRKRTAEGYRRYYQARRSVQKAQRVAEVSEAAAEVGSLTDREILIAGAIAYWCEGTKDKPYRQAGRVDFINNDPALISFFLKFLESIGVRPEDLIFRMYIHENADVESAQQYWLELTGAPPDQFRPPVLKHHNPKTVRKNTGDNYRGCLRIDVRRSSRLYRKIEGWAAAVMSIAATPEDAPSDQDAQP